ncbi:hypothetical protein IB257_30025 [Achromobacter sp. ACM03]|uniref:hypothetical protein n=1 Tax=Achromobacter sp. ACM03 TaxID=2769300 RepID=UPI00177C2CCB|nr:hypothetical protein [Achromobacter sp. ACM03]MBD9434196.1 hypothetical protein [Achromobacter sp. ACM03]
MTDNTTAAQAAHTNPLSDEYVNAVIQQHGYQSPETVIARLNQWIGLHGGENGVTLLMYEAHKALVKLRAPVADSTLPLEQMLHELVSKIDTGLDTGDLLQDARRASTVLDTIMTGGDLVACAHTFFKECGEDKWRDRYERSLDFRLGWNACLDAIDEARAKRAALASAPVAGEATDWPTPAQEAEAAKQWDAWAHEMNQCRDASLEQAARICDAEGQEWDSDAVITEKNYAEHCGRRIRALKGSAAPQASEAVRNDGFSDGVITALEVMTSHGDWGSTAYCELLQAAGLEAVVRRAIGQETWETAGLDRTPMAIECRAALSAQPEQS